MMADQQLVANPILRARDVLVEIANANGGRITPDMVVAQAESPDHPLHDRFEWNDAAAGHKFRLIQAAIMIRACKVKIETSSGPRVIRELVSVERGDRLYHHVRVVVDDVDRRNLLLEQAYRDLHAFTKRYENLVAVFQEPLDALMKAIVAAIETRVDDEEVKAETA